MKLLEGFALGGPPLIGLDIGTTAVKAARIRRKGRHILVTGLAWAALDAVNAEGSPVSDKTALAIWRCVKILRNDAAVCSVSGPDVAVRTFEFPALPRKELASAMELEAMQVCPFEISEGAVAYQVLRGPAGRIGKGESAERMVGIFAAAKKTLLQQRKDLCEEGKARCVVVDVDGLALLNCLEACGPEAGGPAVLVLDVGATYTNLALLAADGQPFVQDIEHGGTEIVRLAAESAHRTPEAVLAALAGSEEAEISHKNLRSGLRKACAPLAEQVLETLRYHGARKGGCGVEKVLLCGGVAQAEAVVEVLGGLLERPVERWDPLASLAPVRRVRKSELAGHGPLFAVALGLAMRSVHDVPN